MALRGVGSTYGGSLIVHWLAFFKRAFVPHLNAGSEPLYLYISAPTQEGVDVARSLADNLVLTVRRDWEAFRMYDLSLYV